MTPQEYKAFSTAVKEAPKPSPLAAAATAAAVEETQRMPVREQVILPTPIPVPPAPPKQPDPEPEPEQIMIPAVPQDIPWRYVGELYNSYIIVEQGDEAYLIDKHAAHERILFEKLKANQESISSQTLLTPIPHRLSADSLAVLLENLSLLEELGFEVQEFGENTLLIRQIPMDLDIQQAGDALETLAADLQNGRREKRDTVRDTMLHTVACKAAIKAGWQSSDEELKKLAEQVLSRDDLKHCPHGRPICITLSKKQLERQFKRA
jgi:DNA mismatch repair protein MutL